MRRSASGSRRKGHRPGDAAAEKFARGLALIERHPMFQPLCTHTRIWRIDRGTWTPDAWAVAAGNGAISISPKRRAEPEEWVYVLAHCLLHLGLGHFRDGRKMPEWNIACDCFVARLLAEMRLGRPPFEVPHPFELPAQNEDALYEQFLERGVPEDLRCFGVGGTQADMLLTPDYRPTDWPKIFGRGVAMAVASAVSVAGGHTAHLGADKQAFTPGRRAREWFISSYPLLGALAAAFDVIEDPVLCNRMEISVAAVDDEAREIYLNPAAGLDDHECRFVMAHELLHVGLRHSVRRQGRHPFLWNVACDYVINGWLVEMGVGDLPQVCALHDLRLKGESAEAIYDRLVADMRRACKLATLAGIGRPDMIEKRPPDWWSRGSGVDLDDFYRRCLMQGLDCCDSSGRGLLPAGLVEEIRALAQPPIPWDVELAQWFDDHFSPLERVRTYARPSRRQSATPEIPRPRWVPATGADEGRTFGVVLDTSGSMERTLLAKALGTIAGYSLARDVTSARVVFCDATAYDEGYLSPEAIAGRVRIRGRGGTVLQPGIDLLEHAEDFPKEGPILVITDGYCDRLRIRREHAFLVPEGRYLPFVPRGPVFRIR